MEQGKNSKATLFKKTNGVLTMVTRGFTAQCAVYLSIKFM